MLQTFVPNASDGWRLATASVRDLYAEGDLHADEVGGDFAEQSERLGAPTVRARRHGEGAAHRAAGADWFGTVARQMGERLTAAIEVVPQLAEHADGLRELYAAVAATTEPVVRQRVHGDLHLGQVLRTATGWIVLDFEGEPAQPLPARRELDSPLRGRGRDAAAASTTPPGTCWSSSPTTPRATGPRSGPPATRPSAPATPAPVASTRAATHHSFGRSRRTRRFTNASTRHATARTG